MNRVYENASEQEAQSPPAWLRSTGESTRSLKQVPDRPAGDAYCGFGDFDFLLGIWKVRHRQLSSRLLQCTCCREFVGRSEVRKILGGFGIMDENILFEPHGTYRAMALCTFDVAGNCWSIWWYDGRVPGSLESPLRGKFERGVGVFQGAYRIDGTCIRTRHVWTQHPEAPRLERALSMNDGHTWETNWIMEFQRIP